MKLNQQTIIRFAIAVLFIWFGTQQLLHTDSWLSWLPSWAHTLPIPATVFLQLNGAFEVVLGTLLLLGLATRVTALILALHLYGITFSIGYNDIGVRDFILATTTLTLGLIPSDPLALEHKIKTENQLIKLILWRK